MIKVHGARRESPTAVRTGHVSKAIKQASVGPPLAP
jgi:hypothetical protein